MFYVPAPLTRNLLTKFNRTWCKKDNDEEFIATIVLFKTFSGRSRSQNCILFPFPQQAGNVMCKCECFLDSNKTSTANWFYENQNVSSKKALELSTSPVGTCIHLITAPNVCENERLVISLLKWILNYMFKNRSIIHKSNASCFIQKKY